MNNIPRVAIVGGSIGGLTAGLVLRDLGCEVDIYERSTSELEARGAGIVSHPVTVRYFEERHPLDADKVMVRLPWLRFLGREGEILHEERQNYRFTSWNTLYRNLLAHFDPDRYHLGYEMIDLDQDVDEARVYFADGQVTAADLVVCADGVSSRARTILQRHVKPHYAGYVAWRGTTSESKLSAAAAGRLGDAITYHLTDEGHILTYPIPGPRGELEPGNRLQGFVWYHNYAEGEELEDLLCDRTGMRRTTSVPPGLMRDEYVNWVRRYAAERFPAVIAELVSGIPSPFVQVVYDAAVDRMAFGRIGLMGDGAIAVRPHAGAGTAKACADAWALGDALGETNVDVTAALAGWGRRQMQIGYALLERARWIGDGSQFRHDWVPGDPRLRFGLYRAGDAAFAD